MRSWIGILGMVVAGTMGCAPREDAQDAADAGDAQEEPTPALEFGARVDSISRDSAVAYAKRRLRWDTSYARSDVRRVAWRQRGQAVVGPIAEIAPERGAHRLSRRQLAEGRIIARVRTAAAIPPLGLTAGVSYLYVDSIAQGFRWVIIPENPTEPMRQLPLGIRVHSGLSGRPLAGRAAFLLDVAAGGIQVPCTPYGCCCIDPSGGPPPCDDPIWRSTVGVTMPDFADIIGPRIVTLPGVPPRP